METTGSYNRVILPNSSTSSKKSDLSPHGKVVCNLKLNDANVGRLQIAKTFGVESPQPAINAVSFSDNGERLITCGEDDQIYVYDAVSGVLTKDIGSKKYGAEHVTFTHSNFEAVHASNKIDDALRHLDLNCSSYKKYFVGHSEKVTFVKMCPLHDVFMSGSEDKTLRLWDVRSSNGQGQIRISGYKKKENSTFNFVGAFEPCGLAFALGIEDAYVKLFDMRTFDRGPFSSFHLDAGESEPSSWYDLKFSPDGRKIVVATVSKLILIDAFSGEVLHTFNDHLLGPARSTKNCEPCFSPCSRYLFCGSPSGGLYVWSCETGKNAAVLERGNISHRLKFSPTFFMMASGGAGLFLWAPAICGVEDSDYAGESMNEDAGVSSTTDYPGERGEMRIGNDGLGLTSRLTDLSKLAVGH